MLLNAKRSWIIKLLIFYDSFEQLHDKSISREKWQANNPSQQVAWEIAYVTSVSNIFMRHEYHYAEQWNVIQRMQSNELNSKRNFHPHPP